MSMPAENNVNARHPVHHTTMASGECCCVSQALLRRLHAVIVIMTAHTLTPVPLAM